MPLLYWLWKAHDTHLQFFTMFAWNCCIVYCHWIPLVLEPRGQVPFTQHHRWVLIIHGCRLSATEHSQTPLPMSGTDYHATSHQHHPYHEFSVVISRPIFSAVLFPTYCVTCKVTSVIVEHFNRFCYLITDSCVAGNDTKRSVSAAAFEKSLGRKGVERTMEWQVSSSLRFSLFTRCHFIPPVSAPLLASLAPFP